MRACPCLLCKFPHALFGTAALITCWHLQVQIAMGTKLRHVPEHTPCSENIRPNWSGNAIGGVFIYMKRLIPAPTPALHFSILQGFEYTVGQEQKEPTE